MFTSFLNMFASLKTILYICVWVKKGVKDDNVDVKDDNLIIAVLCKHC